jgi:hypothetical protein
LLLAGSFHDHGALNFKAIANGVHTPVVDLNTELRGIVKWDLKHIETISAGSLANLLSADGPCYVPARLKEQTAIALQQKLLSDLGRVGELKPMLSMFPVRCVVYFTNAHRELVALPTNLDGVLVGENTNRLAFDAAHRFDFMKEVREAIADAYNTSNAKLQSALEPPALDSLFTTGVEYKSDIKPKPCKVPGAAGEVEIGKIIFNQSIQDAFSEPSQHQGAGLVFELTEQAANT